MATTARAEGSCTEFEFGPLVPYSIVCLRLPASFSDAMNEYVLVIAIAAIPVITYVFVRRLGISRTPEGKFWMTLSAGVALVLLIVTEPGPGGPTRASIWLIFSVRRCRLASEPALHLRRSSWYELAPSIAGIDVRCAPQFRLADSRQYVAT